MRRAIALISLVLAAAILTGPGTTPTPAAPAEPRASLTDIEDEVMCPICGTPLNLAEAPQAERQRAFIRRLIASGETKDEIKDALVREYGPEVLATPESEGFDLAAWLVPAGGILLAALALAFGVRRWRGRGPDRQSPAGGDELDAADSERLRSDLARYDL
jgi:cytochrome c-type biogenesis protein CcmH/NrfF